MINSFEVNAFAAVAEHRSFAEAARELGISDRRISETIIGLERKLGCKLVRRDTRVRGITKEGQAYLEYVKRLDGVFDAALILALYENCGEAAVKSEIGPPLPVLEAEEVLRRFRQDYAPPDAGETANPP